MRLDEFANELRKWWSFDDRQQHTHSWHSREDFIEKKLPELLAKWKGETSVEHTGSSKLMIWLRDHINYSGDDCLIWPFGRTRDGYGMLRRGGAMIKVHRHVCQITHGDPPSHKHQAAHSCGKGHLGCVNPRHISWKSPKDNQNDRLRHGQPFTGRRRRFNPEQVTEIRGMQGKVTSSIVGAQFGVSEAAIRHIWAGRAYKDHTAQDQS